MGDCLANSPDGAGERSEPGMSRFFNLENVDRYRRLASGATDAAERRRLMTSLAKELNAFRQEVKRRG